ncbi:hypothetical protein BHE74_00003957 [Ensete ventricosum]|nr:hypothetical protein BHE74_00003957 [Ensete ventricosum]RZS18165.1 hypothetical protein BHM03_00050395 [Ensete ventricosum]
MGGYLLCFYFYKTTSTVVGFLTLQHLASKLVNYYSPAADKRTTIRLRISTPSLSGGRVLALAVDYSNLYLFMAFSLPS